MRHLIKHFKCWKLIRKGAMTTWRFDEVAKMLGINKYGCPVCGYNSIEERDRLKAKVILFKESGKYYTEEEWEIPSGSIGPYDMRFSPDFRRIGQGPVLVVTQEPWGYPHLLVVSADE